MPHSLIGTLVYLAIVVVALSVGRRVVRAAGSPAARAIRDQIEQARAAAQSALPGRLIPARLPSPPRPAPAASRATAPPPPARRPQPRPPATALLLSPLLGGPALLRSLIVTEALAQPVALRERPPGAA